MAKIIFDVMIIELNRTPSYISLLGILLLLAAACVPKQEVVFKGIKNIEVESAEGDPLLKANAFFYNPNNIRMKLKEISIDVKVNGKQSAQIRQQMKLPIPAQAEFSVPLEAKLSLKELGLLDTIMNILGGKKYEVRYEGYLRVAVHGITVKVPVDYKEELRLKF
jgi:LEA14-like dessication related protein